MEKHCLNCGKRLTNLQRKYCSIRCKNQVRAPHFGTSSYRPMPSKEVENCVQCGKQLKGRQTLYCSKSCKHIVHDNSFPSQRRRGIRRKLELINRLGGKCTICGYNKNIAALAFHHKYDKKIVLDKGGLARKSMEVIEAEIEKCELLCENCHVELHNPLLHMSKMDEYRNLTFASPDQLKQETKFGVCIICDNPLEGRRKYFCSAKCRNMHHQDYEKQRQRGIVRKLELISHFGSKCVICGYDRNLAVLNFHHLDPEQKDYQLDLQSLSNRSIASILEEFEKCQLVCKNCHMELHYPNMEMRLVRQGFVTI